MYVTVVRILALALEDGVHAAQGIVVDQTRQTLVGENGAGYRLTRLSVPCRLARLAECCRTHNDAPEKTGHDRQVAQAPTRSLDVLLPYSPLFLKNA